MEKITKSGENNISLEAILKDVIVGTIVSILVSLISANFFAGEKNSNTFSLLFFASLIFSLVIFLFIVLIRKLLKEIEAKKDLERQKEKIEESLKLSQMFRSHAEKDKEKLEKENKKLENKFWQLRYILSWCGISQEEVGIDENISVLEWEKNPEIKSKVEEITNKIYEEWREAERDVSDLSYQLEEECKISKDNQYVSDKRQRKWVIEDVENYWNYAKADRNGKLKGKNIEQFLPINWKENFQKKEGKEIIEEKYRLKKLIDEFANSAK